MYDPKSLDELAAQIEQQMGNAMREQRFNDVRQYATALERLQAWIGQNQPGDLPTEVTAVRGVDWQAVVRPAAVAPTPTQRAAPPTGPLPLLATDENNDAATTFAATLQLVSDDLARNAFAEAQSRLTLLRAQATDPTERNQLEEIERQVRERRRTALERAVTAARSGDRGQQRQLWNAVLRIDPAHSEASEALKRLDELAVAQGPLEQLNAIRAKLAEIQRDITKVEEAQRTVQTLLYDPIIRDSVRRQEAEDLLKQLTTFRENIQKASEGGTSSERSSDFERAIEVYRRAIMAGYETIIDDTTGQPVNPSEALRRTQAAFFKELVRRSEARYNDADQVLKAGAPEVAVQRLTEAQELLSKVQDNSGVEWRAQVEKLLDEAQQQAEAKREAETLVIEAEAIDDPQQARLRLLRAQQRYRTYPQIEERIQAKAQQVLRSVVNDLRTSLARAETLLSQRNFDEARQLCEQALRFGQNLDFADADDEYQSHHSRALTLLERIGVAQNRWQTLQEQLAAVRAAITANNLTLARRLLDNLDAEDAAVPAVTHLRTELSLLGDDDQKWRDAQQAFGAQSYEQVIVLCEKLQESASVRSRAADLLRRAQARWWSQQAAAATSLTQAEEFYRKLVGLRGLLPAEDAAFVDNAEQALKRLREERSRHQQLHDRLKSVHQLRMQGKWTEWYQRLTALEQEAPESFKGELLAERSPGIEEWRIDAFDQAERLLLANQSDRWRRAHELVHPLYRVGAVADDDALYQKIASAYHQSEAERWEASNDPRDLEKAVEHRRNAFNLAEKPALVEKRALVDTIRQLALRKARFVATNPGPQEAVTVLQQQLTEYDYELKEDPELHEHLLRYALLAGKFEIARRETQVLQFLPGLTDRARSWQHLVQALQDFQQENGIDGREHGVRELARLRTASTEADDLLAQTVAEFAVILAEGLHTTLPPMLRTPTNEDILQRVRVYDLILQLRPDDNRARNGIAQLADRLQQIGQQLAERVRRLLGSQQASTQEELRQLETLDGELRALLQAFGLLNQAAMPVAQQLLQQQERVQRRLQQLNDLHRQLDEVHLQYRRVITETWVVEPVAGALQSALQTARQVGVGPQLATWEERVNQLGDLIAGLKSTLAEVERAWVSDQFQAVITGCDRFNQELNRARMALGANEITLPRDHLVLYDGQGQRRLSALDDIRTVASVKEQNLLAWRRWVERFQTLQGEMREATAAAEQELGARLPCLTRGRTQLVTLLQRYETLQQHLGQLPPDPLCKEAERYAKQMREADLQTLISQQVEQTRARLASVDTRLTEVAQPLQRLRTFMRGNPNLRLDLNQRTFGTLSGAVQQIDACNPDLEAFIELYKRSTSQAN